MIEVKGLNKKFDDFEALIDLNLNVQTGSIYGLVGVNGSGKTTLIRHLTGVLRQDSGSIKMDGEDIYDNENIKRRVGYIPDELYFFNSYNIYAMSRFYKNLYPGWSDERYSKMLADFSFKNTDRLAKLSKGMQKQAQFILTMSCMPDFLILDEPIDGLDPVVRKKVWRYVVDDVAERSMTVLVSSHNLREMEGICDSIGILSAGSMKLERELDELKSDIHKVQVAFHSREDAERAFASLNVLSREGSGSVEHLIVRGGRQEIENHVFAQDPIIFDILPLSLEEVFIYEMGGAKDEIKSILS
ncbi:MAG: ABC transporter ATP-binding protein [Clostridiales bacterium]|nr:ABC transporter ATP-binding protein [Clostridiales bacterium]